MSLRSMHLGFSLTPFGHHPAAWRLAAPAEGLGFDALLAQVSKAEHSGFDFAFLSDRLGLRPDGDLSSVATPFEPTTLVAALATRAGQVGFIAAAATAQHEPYNLARRFASLDLISGGRTGCAIVTGEDSSGAGQEYVAVVSGLWDSWEDDAFIYDKSQGRFFQPEKMHVLNHKGQTFSVRGPLNVNRSPQGKPVLALVANGNEGSLMPQFAELVLLQSDSPTSAEVAKSDLVRSLEGAGRNRDDVKVLVNVLPFIGATRNEAQALHDRLQSTVEPTDQPLQGATLIGTAREIADALQNWFEAGNVDGFTILPPTTSCAEAFFERVMPNLACRGLIGTNPPGATLRERLGLSRPSHPAETGERVL